MNHRHLILVWISIDLMAGLSKLKDISSSLKGLGEVLNVSSIYKKSLYQRNRDLNSELDLVLKVETELNQSEVFQFLKSSEHSKFLSLLSFDQDVRLFPGENLPNPLLHSDKLTLRCAAEAWGGYVHPVLGQTLNELVRSQEPLPNVEFFAQGRSLFPPEAP